MRRLGTSKHSGVIGLFDKEFIKPGILSKELSKSLHLAFDYRQTHDYGEMIEIEQDTAKKVLEDSKEFVKEVESYLISQGYL